ncbi:hypothetical protein CEE35_05100 [Candidatus Aerophobetes bacterium Ae_b3b]|nr:MAG: hypothetical protein CEE35_05100 [Candidatus Aerophobetes bacterium Ae_b3b]
MKSIARWWERCIIEKGKESLLWAFIAFATSVLVSRAVVLDVEKGKAIFGYLYIKGYHIHHFYFGILFLILSNWLALIRYKRLYRRVFKRITSVIFGGGLGLVVDEFGLLLTMEFGLKGNYWAPQSYYAIGVTTFLFLGSLLFLKAD